MRILGVVIAVVGVALLVFGFHSADAPLDRVSETLTGRYTDTTMWYLIGGIAALIGGGLLAVLGPRRA